MPARPRPRMPGAPPRQRGSALLLAMIILTLVATLASAMVWQQQRAIQVEAAERARGQAGWILVGALDWARLVLREDQRTGGVDHLGEPWAVPLAEARLSTFLATERDPTADDGPEAFLSGSIVDLQARYNVQNLLDEEGKVVPAELAVLERLLANIGMTGGTAERIADGLAAASGDGDGDRPLYPQRFDQLNWLGLSADTLKLLEPYLTLLPGPTPVNVNTAPREVLAAVIDELDLGSAERLLRRRQGEPFANLDALKRELPPGIELPENRVGVSSRYFQVTGRLRLDQRVLEERSAVVRPAARGGEVVALWRQRRSAGAP